MPTKVSVFPEAELTFFKKIIVLENANHSLQGKRTGGTDKTNDWLLQFL